jgi:transposase-like protein
MRKTVTGKRLFSREFKVAAVKRVLGGEPIGRVARDLQIGMPLLWRWKKRVIELGEDHLYEVGARRGQRRVNNSSKSQERRIAELERLVGRQQAEISFLDKALRRVEELRHEKKDDGGAASSK